MTFESWLHRWLEVYKIPYLKSSSIARINVSIRNHIPSWIKKMSLDRLTAFDVDRAISFCKLPRSRKYVYYIYTNSLHRAYCLDLIPVDLSKKINLVRHRQERGRALTHQEQSDFVSNIRNSPYKNAFLFLLFSGVRRGELLSIKFSDVLRSDRLIAIHGTKTETSDRFIILSPVLESIIDEQLKNAVSDYVFPYKGDTLTHWFKVFCPGHKLHDLRHTFITLCAESGVNINVTQNLVGHKTLNTTLAIYTHISLDFVRKEFEKFVSFPAIK